MDNEVLASVQASAVRRWTGVVMLGFVGFLLIYSAVSAPPALKWQAFLIVAGVFIIWMADRVRRVTEHGIELTTTELRETSGVRLAYLDDIVGVDRGVFAFKPSNGFVIRTKMPGTRRWRPGMWWRFGRRIGIGGVMPASGTKMMAEALAAAIANRDQQDGSQQT